jgi:ribose 5-phosphate isomerase A
LFVARVTGDLLMLLQELKELVGVVEHGLFIGMASAVMVAGESGVSEIQR